MINRRSLFSSAAKGALAVGVLGLAGCAAGGSISQVIDSTLGQVVNDAKLVAGGAETLANFLGVNVIPASVNDIVQKAVAGIDQVASDLGQALTEAQAKPLVVKLEQYGEALLGAALSVGGGSLPAVAVTIIEALQVLLPDIAKVLGLAGVQAAPAGKMDVYTARAVLAAYGTRK